MSESQRRNDNLADPDTYADMLKKGLDSLNEDDPTELDVNTPPLESTTALEFSAVYTGNQPSLSVETTSTSPDGDTSLEEHREGTSPISAFTLESSSAADSGKPEKMLELSESSSEYESGISSLIDIYHANELRTLYHRAMNTVHAWLVWHGFGYLGNTDELTSRIIELAQRAVERSAVPSLREIWALEVAIDCRRELQRFRDVEGGGRWEYTIPESDLMLEKIMAIWRDQIETQGLEDIPSSRSTEAPEPTEWCIVNGVVYPCGRMYFHEHDELCGHGLYKCSCCRRCTFQGGRAKFFP